MNRNCSFCNFTAFLALTLLLINTSTHWINALVGLEIAMMAFCMIMALQRLLRAIKAAIKYLLIRAAMVAKYVLVLIGEALSILHWLVEYYRRGSSF